MATRAIILAGKEPQVSNVGEFSDLEWAKRACLADPAIAGLIPQEKRYRALIWIRQGSGWADTPEPIGDYPTPEAARHGAEKHAGAALNWQLPPGGATLSVAVITDSTGHIRGYSVFDRQAAPEWQPMPGHQGAVGIDFQGDGVTIGYAISPVPQAATRPQARPASPQQQVPTRKGEQLWVVQSGRSSVLHLMRSKTPSTPNPMSPGSIIAELAWFGGKQQKLTLCGRPATRQVDVFAPREATCRECKRRAGFS